MEDEKVPDEKRIYKKRKIIFLNGRKKVINAFKNCLSR